MQMIPVSLGERSYDIAIADGLLDRAGDLLGRFASGRPFTVVTDESVAKAQWPRLQLSLEKAGHAVRLVTLPSGEGTKSWSNLEHLVDALLANEVERSDHIIALGGGVIGDLVGFAAAIVKRGCHFIQIPTTLLSQVDSSVGGKTAINTRAGKNLVGAFHQPAFVLIDPTTLDSLDPREVRAGYAEVVKYGLIDNPAFFDWCETHGERLLRGDSDARAHAIAVSVAAKATIVADDERETTGRRALLNLGHTFGHALEAETGYSARLLHGEAVAAGMALAFRFSAAQGICHASEAARVTRHLHAAGLPHDLASAGVEATGARLVEHMRHDKKKADGAVPFLLARGIGQTYLDKTVDMAAVEAFLDGERATAGA